MGNQPSIIDQQTKEHCIFMYSTTVCSFCTKAKTLLNDLDLDFGLVELNKLAPGESGQIVLELRERTKQNTVSFHSSKLTRRKLYWKGILFLVINLRKNIPQTFHLLNFHTLKQLFMPS